ncbi:hypothetical protein LTR78_000167 [Recurvomyces mirabilis]|uniref:Uncharacterized protein n=1 Tax=Recurvomyces mirabilis TaxID=574656 RepID=A0AAE1C6C3_9PEZI|nr:hypothetical protein LTR78_000167 [Recurvomyces mirabilis]KAK5161824.1 hypothetical protein LTS14_000169 [Recurvomyces mirabilis]
MAIDQLNSRLLDLCPELRNAIYTHTLVSHENIVVSHDLETKMPSLFATCRQIREETYAMFYSLNSFTVRVSDKQKSTAMDWLKDKSRNTASLIKNMTLEYDPSATCKDRGHPIWHVSPRARCLPKVCNLSRASGSRALGD